VSTQTSPSFRSAGSAASAGRPPTRNASASSSTTAPTTSCGSGARRAGSASSASVAHAASRLTSYSRKTLTPNRTTSEVRGRHHTPFPASPSRPSRSTIRLPRNQDAEKGAYGIRTRAAAVRGRCPRPLDECAGGFSVAAARAEPSHAGKVAQEARRASREQAARRCARARPREGSARRRAERRVPDGRSARARGRRRHRHVGARWRTAGGHVARGTPRRRSKLGPATMPSPCGVV
jgi:hypothetical protein